MLGLRRWLLVAVFAVIATTSPPSRADMMAFGQRWYEGDVQHTGVVYKTYQNYSITGPDVCYGGQDWCVRTSQNSDVGHYHFTQDFTTQERDRAELYLREVNPDSQYIIGDTLTLPTTDYNCHAMALTGRTDIWVVNQALVLFDDYHFATGPPAVGQVMKHAHDHSSIISGVQQGPMGYVSTKVISKWGGWGRYESSPAIYGGPTGRYEHN